MTDPKFKAFLRKLKKRPLPKAAPPPAEPVPAIGMGVTIFAGSDRHAGTISRISSSGKTFWFRQDDETLINADGLGIYGNQHYTFAPNLAAPEVMVQRRRGFWKINRGWRVSVGERDAYYDPSK